MKYSRWVALTAIWALLACGAYGAAQFFTPSQIRFDGPCLLGTDTVGRGGGECITVGTGLDLSSNTLSNTGGGSSSSGGDDNQTATEVASTPAGTIAATNVQSALNELDTEKPPNTRAVTVGTGLSGGGTLEADRSISLGNTTVTPGSYTYSGITVDAQGRLTAASNGNIPDTAAEVSADSPGAYLCTTVQACIDEIEGNLGTIASIDLGGDPDTCVRGDGTMGECGSAVGAPAIWYSDNTLGTSQEDVSDTTLTLSTSAIVETEHVVIVAYSVDNITSPGATASATTDCTVTGPSGLTFTRATEATAGNTASTWATTGIFYSEATSQQAAASTITLTCNSATTAKSMSAWEFHVAGTGLTVTVSGTDIQADSSPPAGATAVSLSGLTSGPYLWLYAIGVERQNTGTEQKDADYTTMGANVGSAPPAGGSGTTDHMELNSSYRIMSGTGDTVAPTSAVANRDMVSVLVALKATIQVAGLEGDDVPSGGDLVLNVPEADFNSPDLGTLATGSCQSFSTGTHTVSHVQIDANGASDCINITGDANVTIDTIRIFDCEDCIRQTSTGNLLVTNSEISDFSGAGVKLEFGSNPTPHPAGQVEIEGNWIHDSNTGCTTYTTTGGCSGARGNGVNVRSRLATVAQPIYIHDNQIWNMEYSDVRMVNSHNMLVDFNALEGTNRDKVGWCESPSSDKFFSNCHVTNNYFVGIDFTSQSAWTFTNCQPTTAGSLFQGNLVEGLANGAGGVGVFGLCDVDIIGNRFDGDVPSTPAVEQAYACAGVWADGFSPATGTNTAVGNEFFNCKYPIFVSEDQSGSPVHPVTVTDNRMAEPYTTAIVGAVTCNSNSSCASNIPRAWVSLSQYTISGNQDFDTSASVDP